MSFSLPSNPPTDPAYLRFLDGLKRLGADPRGSATLHWHPRDEKWYTYAPVEWGMEVSRLPPTPPGLALRARFGWPTPAGWDVNEFEVPELFARVQQAYARSGRPTANLVWAPADGGAWRIAFQRAASPPPHVPIPTGVPLPPPCVARAKQVQEWERRGFVTHDQAQAMINAIVAECT
jgi:hypothetical protein